MTRNKFKRKICKPENRLNGFIIRILFCMSFVVYFSCVSVHAGSYIASINGKKYTSLQSAVNHVKNDQTIKLLRNVNTKNRVTINIPQHFNIETMPRGGWFTIDMNNKKYVYTGPGAAIHLKSGSLTVKRMNIVAKKSFQIDDKGSLEIDSGTNTGRIKNEGSLWIFGGKFKKKKSKWIIQNYGELLIFKGTFYGSKTGCIYTASNSYECIYDEVKFKKSAKLYKYDFQKRIPGVGYETANKMRILASKLKGVKKRKSKKYPTAYYSGNGIIMGENEDAWIDTPCLYLKNLGNKQLGYAGIFVGMKKSKVESILRKINRGERQGLKVYYKNGKVSGFVMTSYYTG